VLENEHLHKGYANKIGLIADVNKHLESGWEPLGGISMKQSKEWTSSANTGQHTVYTTYIQAIVRK